MGVAEQALDVGNSFWGRVFHEQSKGWGAKRTDYPLKHEFVAWEYTRHNDGSSADGGTTLGTEVLPTGAVRIRTERSFEKGLSTTRFHKGFQRRMQSHIQQDATRLEREASKQRLSLRHLDRRRQRLRSLDKRNGFNLITGEFDAGNRRCTTPFHIKPITRDNGSLSEVAERAEYLLLRDSKYKFHAPAWSGKNHDERQDIIQREGLNKAKKSALLGIGSADLASAGVEDMFSKAIYDPAKSCAVEGLVEMSIPGRYTPRKLAAARAAPVQPNGRSSGEGHAASTPALGAAFRVVPNGLGKFCTRRENGGSVAPGIAPPKQLCESQSAPVLKRDPRGPRKLGAPSPAMAASSPVIGGGGGNSTAGSVGSREVTARSILSEKSQASGASTVGDGRSARGSFIAGGERRSGHGLSRCGSEFGRQSAASGHGATVESGDAGLGFMQKSASVGHLASPGKGGPSAIPGSACWSRGVSPAQRRVADQVTLDVAAVRSLAA